MQQTSALVTVLRYALGVCLLALPLVGPGAMLAVACVVVTVTAYAGTRPQVIYGMLAVVVAIELIYGADVGVLSLAYLVSVGVLMAAQRMLSVVPWSRVDGWRLFDAVRTGCVAYAMLSITMLSSVFIGHLLYGSSLLAVRLENTLSLVVSWEVFVCIAGVLLVVRRMDEPFRRRIIFGI